MAFCYTLEWDPDKARANEDKHGIAFEQAALAFRDPLALSIYDEEHSSTDEDRWVTLGQSETDLFVVVHTFREVGADEAVVRIISARRATRRERRQYEER
jgi:uncharacterized DUF497 family protein